MDLAAECGVSQVTIAFSVDPIVLEVGVLLTDGTPLDFVVRVPPVELALIFKAYAAQSPTRPKRSQISTTSCRSRSSIPSTRSVAGRSEPLPYPGRGSTPLESCIPWRRSSGHSWRGQSLGPSVGLARRGEAELRHDTLALAEHPVKYRYLGVPVVVHL